MKKLPIALNIDDGCAVYNATYQHTRKPGKITFGGEKLVEFIPNSFAVKLCDLLNKYNVKGKLSIIPLPGGKNPYETSEGKKWLKIINSRLGGKFSFCPEMLTHYFAYDIKNDCYTNDLEYVWAEKQDANSLQEYIELALKTLSSRGVEVSGVSSPWGFGGTNLENYKHAVSEAYYNVFNKKQTWVFVEFYEGKGKPHLLIDGDKKLVSIPATTNDCIWDTMEYNDTSDEFILKCADKYISGDGKSGLIIDTLNNGGIPCILTHYTSLYSNGRETGLKVLEITLQRIEKFLSDKVEFKSFDEIMKMCINKEI